MRIFVEVVETRHTVFDDSSGTPGIIKLFGQHLPVAPLGAKNVFADIDHESVTGRLLALAVKKIFLVHDVNDAIVRRLPTGDFSQSGEQVQLMHYFVRNPSRSDPSLAVK